MTGRLLTGWVVLVAAACTLLYAPNAAFADTCSPTDPTCATSLVGSNDPLGDTTGTVDSTANDVAGGATAVVQDTTDQAQSTVTHVRDGLGDALNGGGDPGPSPSPSSGGAGGQADRPEGQPRSTRTGAARRVTHPPLAAVGGRFPASIGTPTGDVATGVALSGSRLGRQPSFFSSPAGRAITTVAHALAFPVALLVLVLAFVAVQQRIDRRSPKLALARVDRDRVEFS